MRNSAGGLQQGRAAPASPPPSPQPSPSGRGRKTPRRLPLPKPAGAVLPPQRSLQRPPVGEEVRREGAVRAPARLTARTLSQSPPVETLAQLGGRALARTRGPRLPPPSTQPSPSGRGRKTPRRLPLPKPAGAVLPPQRSFAKASGGRGGKKGGRCAGARAPNGAYPLSVSPSGDPCATRRAGFSKDARPPPPPALNPTLSQRERGVRPRAASPCQSQRAPFFPLNGVLQRPPVGEEVRREGAVRAPARLTARALSQSPPAGALRSRCD